MDDIRAAKLDALLDKQDIRECLTRFSRGMDRFDRECFLSAFHDDAQMAAGPFVGSAADCYDWARALHEEGQVTTHHNLLNMTFDIQGDVAHSECYYMFIARNRDDSQWIAGGRYIDRLEKRGGAWKIALRTNAIEWSGLLPTLPLPFGDVPGIADNGTPQRSTEDPSYVRPLVNNRVPFNPAKD